MTVEQQQHLLAYLGLYKGEIDGAYGTGTKLAFRNFQEARNLKPVDGLYGPVTEKELLKVIGSGIKSITLPKTANTSTTNKTTTTTTKSPTKNTGTWWDEIEYFEPEEFACKCGGRYCNGAPAEMDKTLLKVAVRMRKHFKAPVLVSSGLRCRQHNANEGGVANSDHMYGRAMDFCVSGESAATVEAWVKQQPEIKYCYKINNSYVHMNV